LINTGFRANIHTTKENTYHTEGTTMKKNFTEIEEIIENRITELEKEYDLDRWDIQEIRTEAYRENGWGSDPFPLDEKEEVEPEEEWHYRSMADLLAEVGMSMRDFL